MPAAGLMLIVVAVTRDRHIVQMCGQAGTRVIMNMLMSDCRRELMVMVTLHRQIGKPEGCDHCE